MAALLRKYGLLYLAHTVTFFFLCAYSLAASAPHYPYLPALFLPIYLSAAVATSERETGDPLLAVLPITPGEIMKVKFGLAFAFVVVAWLNMGLFTLLQNLPAVMTANVMKLNTLGAIFTLLLAAFFQLGLQFFGRSIFHKAIIAYTALTGVFGVVFFIGIAERGNNRPEPFPLVPFLESVPGFALVIAAAAVVAVYAWVHRVGPWDPGSSAA